MLRITGLCLNARLTLVLVVIFFVSGLIALSDVHAQAAEDRMTGVLPAFPGERENGAEILSAVQAGTCDLPVDIRLVLTDAPFTKDTVLTRIRTISLESGADFAFWVVDEKLFLYVPELGEKRLFARRLPPTSGSCSETIAVILRGALLSLQSEASAPPAHSLGSGESSASERSSEPAGFEPVEDDALWAESKMHEDKQSAPDEKDKNADLDATAVGAQDKPARRGGAVSNRLFLGVAYGLDILKTEEAFAHGIRLGLGVRLIPSLYWTAGYTVRFPQETSMFPASGHFVLRRHPITTGLVFQRALGRIHLGVGAAAEADIVSESVRDSEALWTWKKEEKREVVPSVVAYFTVGVHLAGPLFAVFDLGVRAVIKKIEYTARTSSKDISLFSSRRFQPAFSVGLSVFLF